jgi:hypothetical protein
MSLLLFAQRRLIRPPRVSIILPSAKTANAIGTAKGIIAARYHDDGQRRTAISVTFNDSDAVVATIVLRHLSTRYPGPRKIDESPASGSRAVMGTICDRIRWRDAKTALFHPALTRRHFLGTSAAALAASALPSAARHKARGFAGGRFSDTGMPPRVLDSYKKGIREMLNRPARDPQLIPRDDFRRLIDRAILAHLPPSSCLKQSKMKLICLGPRFDRLR